MKKVLGSPNGVDDGVPVDSALNTVCRSNEDGFLRIMRQYARPGDVIADPTHGSGVFWKMIDRSPYLVHATDLATSGVDARSMPYADESIDMEVFDPPYRYTPCKNTKQDDVPGHGKVDGLYNLTAANLTNTQAVVELYVSAFRESHRVLKVGGFLVVKCQDTVQDGKNIWVHCLLMDEAARIGFSCRDIVIVAPASVLKTRWERQRHFRKAHSYFLVFRKGGHFPFGIPAMESRSTRAPLQSKPQNETAAASDRCAAKTSPKEAA